MKTISKSAKASIAKKGNTAIMAAVERYSVKCAMSILGFSETVWREHAKLSRELTESTEPLIKLVGELNLHACKLATDVIEITYNVLEQQVGPDQFALISKDFDFVDGVTADNVTEISAYWAETAPTVVAKAGRITKEDIRQHMAAVAE